MSITPLQVSDASALHVAFGKDPAMWDYMPVGPFRSERDLADWIAGAARSPDPLFFTFVPRDEAPAGFGYFLRIAPEAGSIEVGFLSFSPRLQRSIAATEAMYRMMRWVFEAGYRRYEWTCNARNIASRRTAQRLAFFLASARSVRLP